MAEVERGRIEAVSNGAQPTPPDACRSFLPKKPAWLLGASDWRTAQIVSTKVSSAVQPRSVAHDQPNTLQSEPISQRMEFPGTVLTVLVTLENGALTRLVQ